MRKYDIVVIGGGPAGVTCAISAHNTYPDKSIALIRREKIALIPCGVPYVMHSLNSVDEDILPDKLVANNGTALIIDEVVDKEGKVLKLKSGKQIVYDKLVLAVGSSPIIPPIRGVKKEGVFLVEKDRNYLLKMKEYAKKSKNVVIIGGGYIGVEMADELLNEGKTVTIVEMLDRLLPTTMDREFGNKVQDILEAAGARILVGRKVNSILGSKTVKGVKLQNGEEISADMDIDNLQIGTHPLLTASPIAYPVINATVDAIKKWYEYKPKESFT